MKKVMIVLGVAILTGALVVSALAGPRWGQRGGGHMMGYGGGPGYCWGQGQAGEGSQDQFRNYQGPESKQIQPGYQGRYHPRGPGFERRHMSPGWGINMINPYWGGFSWGN